MNYNLYSLINTLLKIGEEEIEREEVTYDDDYFENPEKTEKQKKKEKKAKKKAKKATKLAKSRAEDQNRWDKIWL